MQVKGGAAYFLITKRSYGKYILIGGAINSSPFSKEWPAVLCIVYPTISTLRLIKLVKSAPVSRFCDSKAKS